MKNIKLYLSVFAICLASFLTALDFAIVNTGLPTIQKSLNASTIELQWVMNAYVLVICVSLVLFGRLADMFGRKRLLITGIFLFGLASLLAGLSNSMLTLILSRALQGIGSAIIIPSSLALLSDILPDRLQNKGFAAWTAINGIGFAAGPVLGGMISQHIGWPWIFYINVPFAIISILLCCLAKEQLTPAKGKIDVKGFIVLLIGIGAITLGLIQSPLWGLTSPQAISSFVIGAISLVLFVLIEKRSAEPLISLDLFLNKRYLAAAIANSTPVLLAYVIFFFLPLFLHQVQGLSVSTIGLILVPTTASMVILSPIIGYLVNERRINRIIFFGILCQIAAVSIMIGFHQTTTLLPIILSGVLFGCGWGIIWGSATGLAISCVSKDLAGVASAALWTIQNMVGCLGLAICGSLFNHSYRLSFVKSIIEHPSLHHLVTQKHILWQDPENFSLNSVSEKTQSIATLIYRHAFTQGFSSVMIALQLALFVAIAGYIILTYKKKRAKA